MTVLIARRPSVRGRDPEAIRSEDERFGADLARAVERYGGTIAGSLGNSGIAVFGVPRVHEDDAFRAVSAALEIGGSPTRDAIDPGSATRVGIATGEVLASGSGAGRRCRSSANP